MPDQLASQRSADPLVNAYRRAGDRIQARMDQMAADPKKWREAARLRALRDSIDSELAKLDLQAREWIRGEIPRIYATGAAAGASEVSSAADFTWQLADTNAAQRLANKLYQDLLEGSKTVKSSTRSLIRAVGRDRALGTVLEGRTAQQAGREMARILRSHGIHAMVYKGGARHGIGEYSEMAIRTITATAHNEGSLSGAAAEGVTYWEVFDGPFCGWTSHDDRQALGMLVTQDEARAHPISHPNCRRAFGPRPDVTRANARDAASSVTPDQTAAQIRADRARQQRTTRPSRTGRKVRTRRPG